MITREETDIILNNIREPLLTDAEFAIMNLSGEVYAELSKIIQTKRGGIGYAYSKLKKDAKINNIELDKIDYSNVFIGAVLK